MTLEALNTALQVASAIVLALTFLVGAGAIWTSYRLGQQQAAQIGETAKDAAAANERAGKLELEAAHARERAASAERTLLELQERVRPRRITGTERAGLTAQLKAFAGTRFHVVRIDDGEVALFTADLVGILEDAGWVLERAVTGASVPPQYGLRMMPAQSSKVLTKPSAVLKEALEAIGLHVATRGEISFPDPLPMDVDTLFIGLKPIGP